MKIDEIYNMDCLVGMKDIEDKSIDLILCDLPYGVLNKSNPSAKWDSIINLDMLWEQYKRIIKDKGAIILFGQGMFTAKLMLSNPSWWKYNLIWKKGNRMTGFLNAKKQPLRNHEDIIVFSNGQTTYNPQMREGEPSHSRGTGQHKNTQRCYGKFEEVPTNMSSQKYPISIIDIPKEHKDFYHPTQKPVSLCEYLIKTYSNENELVLDNCMGSGTTAIACLNTNRHYIGFETEEKYYKIAEERIKENSHFNSLL